MQATFSKLAANKKKQLGKAGLKLFFNLSELWQLNPDDQAAMLGLAAKSTLYRWKKAISSNADVTVPPDTLERLSYIAGIRKNVEILFPEERWNAFMQAPNRQFGGISPLEQLKMGNMSNLIAVREYLESSRGAHFA